MRLAGRLHFGEAASMLRVRLFLTAVIAGSILGISCEEQIRSPATQFHLPREAEWSFDPDHPSAELDSVRVAELGRRAKRPDGDPMRKYALNYDGVLNRLDGEGKRPTPKPAKAMPPTQCQSVEATPTSHNDIYGPDWVHRLTVHMFENESGFGLTRMLSARNRRGLFVSSEVVDRVELVSLLTSAQPSVYILDEMASPPLARQAKRRPLDEFERLGLDAVRRGENTVWTRESPKRMFGAIRAKADCLDCHSKAKEGELLGAFTYYLDVAVDKIDVDK